MLMLLLAAVAALAAWWFSTQKDRQGGGGGDIVLKRGGAWPGGVNPNPLQRGGITLVPTTQPPPNPLRAPVPR